MPRLSLNPLLRDMPQPGLSDAGAGPGVSVEVEAMLSLTASCDRLAGEMQAARKRQERFGQALHLLPDVVLPQITASGYTLDIPEMTGPRTGKIWDVLSVTCNTFTAGTVALYNGEVADMNERYVFPVPGTYWFGGGLLFLQRNDRLVFVSSEDFAGLATLSFTAVELDEWLLPDYLL